MSIKAGVNPLRGEVWTADLDPTVGHEQSGIRPVLIVSDDQLNRSSAGLVIVTPITSTDRGLSAHVRVPSKEVGLARPSVIMPDQIRTISRRRLGRRLGKVSPATIAMAEGRLRLVLGL